MTADLAVHVRHACDVTICDPDDVSALVLAEALTAGGHTTRVREVDQLLADPAGAPVLVIADPAAGGPATALLTALRRSRRGEHATVLAVTATGDPAHAADLLAAGADHVLVRPWSPTLMRAQIAAALRRHHQTCAAGRFH